MFAPSKAKMAECVWLKPVLVGQFEFLEWTAETSTARVRDGIAGVLSDLSDAETH